MSKKRKLKSYDLRIFLLIIAGMACFPVLYLQRRVFAAYPPGSRSEYKNSTAIHNSLESFYALKQHRLQNLKRNQQTKNVLKLLTAYLEPTASLDTGVSPLPMRKIRSSELKKVKFQTTHDRCSRLMEEFPVDDFPLEDPFLPWIHDYFPSADSKYIQFVAQNRRRCDTGEDHEDTMKFWEPQIALFQPIPVIAEENGSFRLSPNLGVATHKETRFQCHFHSIDDTLSATTLSEFSFNYEYVNWRKGRKPMLNRSGKDTGLYWLSQLIFKCPIPPDFQKMLLTDSLGDKPSMYLDLVPIRTPARVNQVLLTANHTGIAQLPPPAAIFDPTKSFGDKHYLPRREDAGRVRLILFFLFKRFRTHSSLMLNHGIVSQWANLPVCRRDKTGPAVSANDKQKHRLVACTWTASSYNRRGGESTFLWIIRESTRMHISNFLPSFRRYSLDFGQRKATERVDSLSLASWIRSFVRFYGN